MVLDEWVAALSEELGVSVPVDSKLLLDVARDAAHRVDRPAAPLTTFLIGYAAASRGGGAGAIAAAAQTAQGLALGWPQPDETPGAGIGGTPEGATGEASGHPTGEASGHAPGEAGPA
jgi:hypothetical protein